MKRSRAHCDLLFILATFDPPLNGITFHDKMNSEFF